MSNGGQYFNHDYGGEVYYNAPSTLGALSLVDKLVNRTKVFPPGVSDANACTAYLELAQGPLGQVGSAIGHERAENRAQNRQKPLLPSEA